MSLQKEKDLRLKSARLEKALVKKNLELAGKNRELELEAALERVRIRAMDLQKPEDLPDICKSLYTELLGLGFEELRNSMINIFQDKGNSIINYDYSDRMGKTINLLRVDAHPTVTKQVKSVRKAPDAFSQTVFRGEDLKAWKAFRKKFGEKDDPRLRKVKALHYYFYSIGDGFIGISTFSSISGAKLAILKRFRNVFTLAYRRYTDLSQARAREKEARIETALERVRSRTMAMNKSDELDKVNILIFRQLETLNILLSGAGIHICKPDKLLSEAWMGDPLKGIMPKLLYDHTRDRLSASMYKGWQKKEGLRVERAEGKKLKEHFDYVLPLLPHPEKYKRQLPPSLVFHFAYFKYGFFVFVTATERSQDHSVFTRFAKVFEQTYTRFLDLQKAEAQTRESQVQLALERVRARTMAMQKSEELPETSHILFEQMKELGEPVEQLTIGLVQEENKVIEISATLHGDILKKIYQHSLDEPFMMSKIYHAWKTHQKTLIVELKGDELNAYNKYRNELTKSEMFPTNLGDEHRRIVYAAFFSKGMLALGANEPRPLESLQLLERFAGVFDQTYIRFLDLQKAEAQAREAQIELALERVRARTMAMHSSDDVSSAIETLFAELGKLGVNNMRCGIAIVNPNKTMEVWSATNANNGQIVKAAGSFDMNAHKLWRLFYDIWKNKSGFLHYYLSGKDKKDYLKTLNSAPGYLSQPILEMPDMDFQSYHFNEGAIWTFSMQPHTEEDQQLMKRFAGVFSLTYRRYEDLQKAEAQAKESKIQLALERVRARTMAMQKSAELPETSFLLFQQVKELGETAVQVSIGIINEETGFVELSTTIHGRHLPYTLKVPIDDPYVMTKAVAAWKARRKSLTLEFEGQELKKYNERRNSFLETKVDFPEERWNVNIAYFSKGWLSFSSDKKISNETFELLKRFAGVFEQTYTRFLDLKKAEAQARESQIEAALERVRSKAMAMHKSDDLQAAVAVVFEELDKLNLGVLRVGISVLNKEKRTGDIWLTSTDEGKPVQVSGDESFDIHPLLQGAFEAWLRQEDLYYVLEGEDLTQYYKAVRNAGFQLPESQMHSSGDPSGQQHAFVAVYHSGGLFAFRDTEFPEEAKKVMKRFAGVFDLTYKRFLDLQKAEAQAREAQIQLALERVRARTMAMQKSDELSETASVLFEQFKQLGEVPERTFIGVVNEAEQVIEIWATQHGGSRMSMTVKATIIEPVVMNPMYRAWKEQKRSLVIDLQGDELESYFQFLKGIGAPVNREIFGVRRFENIAFFSRGMLGVITQEPKSAEAIQLYERFAAVFDLTYTRFLDLQKAEANAREATIEAALEKVRGKAMAMHSSQDLSATASLVFTELRKLGIASIRCGVSLITAASRKAQLYAASSTTEGDGLALIGWVILQGHPVMARIYESWMKQEDYFPELEGEQLRSYYKLLLSGLSVPGSDWQGGRKQYGFFLPSSVGSLFLWSETPYGETEVNILRRFAKIIDLTFRRFFELQKSEANAKEAVRQASLDRVRAEIASMRRVADLDRITPLIWNELTVLGIPFTRCGVFIMDDQQRLMHTFLSTPDGKAIAAFHLPYDSTGNIAQILNHWQAKKNYIAHWDEADFGEFAHNLARQGALASPEQYLKTLPPGGLWLHCLPFLQGMLYVGNTDPLGEDEIKLLQSVADSFSTAYARYEDFNKLEAAKQQVDKTLVDLKQAQQQLVQSEKMASLGELTAGIAHEIQNPLNFVNNFSDVSNELLDEMKTELEKGNADDAKAIAEEVKQNLKKILFHGKRADAIVKGMLQHSRTGSGQKELTEVNALADEYLRLAYHGLRAKDKSFNAKFETDFDPGIGKINIIAQDIGRVILNLINNAFFAVSEKARLSVAGYQPTVKVTTAKGKDKIEIGVRDNGKGIPESILDKIFQPFFTTKPTGQGTGLGLSLAYDIITKGHGGELKVETKEGEGTLFTIHLPI